MAKKIQRSAFREYIPKAERERIWIQVLWEKAWHRVLAEVVCIHEPEGVFLTYDIEPQVNFGVRQFFMDTLDSRKVLFKKGSMFALAEVDDMSEAPKLLAVVMEKSSDDLMRLLSEDNGGFSVDKD
jgi:hypothetical protein